MSPSAPFACGTPKLPVARPRRYPSMRAKGDVPVPGNSVHMAVQWTSTVAGNSIPISQGRDRQGASGLAMARI